MRARQLDFARKKRSANDEARNASLPYRETKYFRDTSFNLVDELKE